MVASMRNGVCDATLSRLILLLRVLHTIHKFDFVSFFLSFISPISVYCLPVLASVAFRVIAHSLCHLRRHLQVFDVLIRNAWL